MEKLTKQEEEVMQQVWQLGECTVKDVLQHMPEPQPPYTTLASVMQRDMVSFFAREEKLSSDDLKEIIQEIESNDVK